MPTYDVKVRFRGLCPFVPGANLDKGEQPAWVGSFLVNASRQNREQFRAMDLPVHLPFLFVKGSDLVGQSRGSQAQMMIPLDFEDIVFVPPNGTQKQLTVNFAHNPAPAGTVPANPAEDRLFNWVTPMSAVLARSGKVDPDCFAPQPRENRIVARVHIDHGTLETDRLGKANNQVIVSQLGSGSRQQATARSVLLTMPCEVGGPFRIKTRSFLAGAATVHELVLKDPGPGNSLELEIVNLCVDDLLLQEREVTLESLFRPDHDFRWSYLLSNGVRFLLGAVPVPQPFSTKDLRALLRLIKNGGGGGSDGSQCSPPRTDPAPAASMATMRQTASAIEQG
jgi:hypothetical protein